MSAYLLSTVMERRPQMITVESPREAEGKVETPGWDGTTTCADITHAYIWLWPV